MQSGTWVGGEVIIDPSAAIAHGVLLQADPDCKVVVGAGVCIGMGAVIHAVGGDISIGAGANLGAGVLLYGKMQVGNNACIGSACSLVNYSVPVAQIIPAGSLLTCSDPKTPTPPIPEPAREDDRLRVHARIHLQQFLSKIFTSP